MVEGSGIFRLNGSDEYVLMYDLYGAGRYEFQRTTDMQTFTQQPESFRKNFHPRHGTVCSVTRNELDRLQQKWGYVLTHEFTTQGNPLFRHKHPADPACLVEGDTLWVFAVFAPGNIGLNKLAVTTASGQNFTLDVFSNDGQVGSIVASVAEPLGKYLSQHPDDPAKAFVLSGSKGKAEGKLSSAFSTATAESYNYAVAKNGLRSALINREKLERRLSIARQQAANGAPAENPANPK